jgi:glycogen synthase
MRILMTADTVGGVWTYSLELIDALADRGIEVHLATMGAPLRPDQRAQLATSQVHAVYAESFRLEWMDEPWADVARARRWLLGLRERIDPDLVHLNAFAHGTLDWHAPLVVVGHSCVLSWFRAVRGKEAPPAWNRYAAVVRDGLASADVVVAPTNAMLDELIELYDPPGRKLVVPNGRTPLSRCAKEPFVFTAGRLWDDAKNVAAVDRVARELAWPVLVAGESDSEHRPRHARSLGPLPSALVAETMGRASIYALPARYEPFGLSALEAGLAGCALVLGDIASLREVWGDAALFVSPGDDSALREAVTSLIENPELRAQLAARARSRAAEFTPARMAEGYLRAYAQARPEQVAA